MLTRKNIAKRKLPYLYKTGKSYEFKANDTPRRPSTKF